MKKAILLLLLLLTVYSYSQEKIDKIQTYSVYDQDDNLVKKGETLFGTVLSIEVNSVKFKLQGTELNMEIPKSDIKKLTLSTGQVITFAPPKEHEEKDSGGVTGWGVVGIVLGVLLVLGIIGALVK